MHFLAELVADVAGVHFLMEEGVWLDYRYSTVVEEAELGDLAEGGPS